jgi:hypothetical protein
MDTQEHRTASVNVIAAGTFASSFATHADALAAARELRTHGFVVQVRSVDGRWLNESRGRTAMPTAEVPRYESRLKANATAFDGAYEGFTPDSAP